MPPAKTKVLIVLKFVKISKMIVLGVVDFCLDIFCLDIILTCLLSGCNRFGGDQLWFDFDQFLVIHRVWKKKDGEGWKNTIRAGRIYCFFSRGSSKFSKKIENFVDLFCPPQNQYNLAPKVFFKNWDTQAR